METLLQQATLTAYEGDKDTSGLCHGQGHAVFSSGQVYEGQWQQGHMHGQGSIQFPDGISYTGAFDVDSISGSGVYSWEGATYEGEVLNGSRHGYGRLAIGDSSVMYDGHWQSGKRHGRGALYYSTDRTAYYEGDWVGDMKHGEGTSVYPSGNTYSGSWVQDQRQGQGTMNWLTRAQRYTGQWMQGLPDGFGEHVWEQRRPAAGAQGPNHAMHVMHNRYVGMFKEGQRHGEGVLYYSSGARYEGQWRHGKKHGQGVYVFEDGNVFSGQFLDDRPVLATGAVLGAASTFMPPADAAGSTAAAAAGLVGCRPFDSSNAAAGSSDALGQGRIVPRAADSSNGKSLASKPASAAAAAAAAAPQKRKAAIANASDKLGKGSGAASATKPGSAASKAAPNKTAKAGATATGAAAAAASAPSKRVSTASSTASAGTGRTPATSRGSTADSQGTNINSSSSCAGPSFGPATSVMQLYIADILQEYEGQPAVVYKAVSNLLVGFHTELRLLYDQYSACVSPLSDADTTPSSSWALQACQLWELLRDAHLLCRHVSLQQVCDIVARATAPPPAVLQHRQQIEPSASAALQQARAIDGCYAASTPLLFRDFCEVLVRLSAVRYPLLTSLEQQLQQVMSYHLLPLLGGSARQLAGGAPRASVIAAAAAATAVGGSEALGGCEQQLRSPAVVQYLQVHKQLLQQLFAALVEAGQGAAAAAAACPATDSSSNSASTASALPQAAPTGISDADSAAEEHERSGAAAAEGASQGNMLVWQREGVLVRHVVSCLQAAGVLEQYQLSMEAAAACLLHNTLAVTDPQGVRACIDDAASMASYMPDSSAEDPTGAAAESPDAALKQEKHFWMDAPLLLQEVLWGLVRLAALLPPPPAPPVPQHTAGSPQGKGALPQQPQVAAAQHQRRSQLSGGAGSQGVQPAAQQPAPVPTAAQALARYQQLFMEDGRGGWDGLLLPRLQALLEGPSGVFRAVLGWQPAQAPTEEQAAPASRCGSMGSAGADSPQQEEEEEYQEGDAEGQEEEEFAGEGEEQGLEGEVGEVDVGVEQTGLEEQGL